MPYAHGTRIQLDRQALPGYAPPETCDGAPHRRRSDGAEDFNQNARDRTIASAYSVRPKPHGPVSAPVTWQELPGVETGDFTIATMPERFARLGDLHAAIDDQAFSLDPLLELADRDERDRGLGDMPYPPNYPKMAGEPRRVQPSKARKD